MKRDLSRRRRLPAQVGPARWQAGMKDLSTSWFATKYFDLISRCFRRRVSFFYFFRPPVLRLTSNVFFLFLLASLYYSCATPQKTSNQNFSSMYRKEGSAIYPQVIVYHTDEQQSRLYFKISSKELLYTRQNSNTEFSSRIQIFYKLSRSFEAKEILDSATLRISDFNYNSNKEILGHLDFKCKAGENYLLEFSLTDMNRARGVKQFVNVEKKDQYGRQNFFVVREGTNQPLFSNYTTTDEPIYIRHKNSKTLYVRYYNRNFPLAAPPFSTISSKPFDFKPDSFFVMQSNDSNGGIRFIPPREGFYHFQSDSAQKEGLTIFRYKNQFPQIQTPEDMLGPLRYLTSKHEYDEIAMMENKKQVVDNFWMSVSGSKERGKELIRKFYNRVQSSNIYFTSYLEGWKTDRGMIYLVYGAPNATYRNSNSETWVYGDGSNNLLTVTFTFDKVINPFSDNDYILYRSAVYQGSWIKAVDMWRQGRVYLDY